MIFAAAVAAVVVLVAVGAAAVVLYCEQSSAFLVSRRNEWLRAKAWVPSLLGRP